MRRRPTPPLLALAALCAGAGPGLAQEAPDTVLRIAPLTVEVLRSPLAGAQTPWAVAGMGEGELRRGRSAAFLSDALVALPGLQIQNRYNFAVGERLAVRGFGARAQFGVRGLRVVVDGIPATLPDGQTTLDHVDVASLGRVELLRGPGSALWGNGAGGVLVLETRVPDPGRRAVVRGTAGSHGLVEGSVQLAETSADGSSTLLSVSRLDWGGFRTDPVRGGTYGAADRWTANARHERTLGSGRLALTVSGVDLEAENPGSLPRDSLDAGSLSAWGFNVRQATGKTVRQAQAGVTWRGTPDGAGPVPELAGWVVTREVENPIPNTVIGLDRTGGGVRAGLGGGPDGGLRWDVGAELELQGDERTNRDNDGGTAGALTLDQSESVRGLGAWGRVAVSAGPATLHGALRHDRVRFEVDDRFRSGSDPDDSGVRTLQAWSPAFGALLPLGDATDAFASVSSFLETPTTTELANRPDGAGGFNPSLDPTRGWAWEAGLRGTVGTRLGWEALVFRTDLRDELVPFEVPEAPGRTFFRNAGRSRHEGWELALRAAPASWLSARAAWTRVDARFRTASGRAEAGDRVPGRAPHRIEASLEGRATGGAFVGLDGLWSAAVPVDDADTVEAPSYGLVDVRAGVEAIDIAGQRVTPFAQVQNVFDRSHVGSVTVNAFGGRYFEPGPGRTFRVGVSVALER